MATTTPSLTNLPQNSSMRSDSGAPMSIPATSEGRRQDLMNRARHLESLDSQMAETKTINQSRLEEMKTRLIQELFKLMQGLGVDPTNLESINEFLQALDQQDPDLRELFESSFNVLVNDKGANPQVGMSSPAQPMFGRDQTLADNTFRPPQQ